MLHLFDDRFRPKVAERPRMRTILESSRKLQAGHLILSLSPSFCHIRIAHVKFCHISRTFAVFFLMHLINFFFRKIAFWMCSSSSRCRANEVLRSLWNTELKWLSVCSAHNMQHCACARSTNSRHTVIQFIQYFAIYGRSVFVLVFLFFLFWGQHHSLYGSLNS